MPRGFMLYHNTKPYFDETPDKDLRDLINALFDYSCDSEETPLPDEAQIAFDVIRCNIDRDRRKYADKCKESQFGNYSDSSDVDDPRINDREYYEAVQRITDMYHSICYSLPKEQNVSKETAENIIKCLNRFGEDTIEEAFIMAQRSDYLKGLKNTTWKATLNWITNGFNMEKILSGQYEDRVRSDHRLSRYENYKRRNAQPVKQEETKPKEDEDDLDPNTETYIIGYRNDGYTDEQIDEMLNGDLTRYFNRKYKKTSQG